MDYSAQYYYLLVPSGQKGLHQQTVNLQHISAIHVFTVLKLIEKNIFG